jgi:hypothetical protein
VAVGADDDHACLAVISGVHHRFPGGRALDRQGRGPEAGGLGQRRAVLGGLLGSVPDVVRAGGVEVCVGLGYEPDAERAPYREDNRVAPGRQLLAGFGDRVPGQVGTVVGDQHGP